MAWGVTLTYHTILVSSWLTSVYAKGGAEWCGTLMCVDAVIRGDTVSCTSSVQSGCSALLIVPTDEMKALNQLGWMAM